MLEKIKIKFNSIKNAREITCIQKRVNIKSNSTHAGSHGGHLHGDCRGKGKGWNSGSISDVSTGHIFSLDF